MSELKNRKFITSIKAEADIHAGGNFFWKTFYDKIEFFDNGIVTIERIFLKENSKILNEVTCLYSGNYKPPGQGYYNVDIELKSNNVSIKYCGKLIDNEYLICHGFVKSKVLDSHRYETEIFKQID